MKIKGYLVNFIGPKDAEEKCTPDFITPWPVFPFGETIRCSCYKTYDDPEHTWMITQTQDVTEALQLDPALD